MVGPRSAPPPGSVPFGDAASLDVAAGDRPAPGAERLAVLRGQQPDVDVPLAVPLDGQPGVDGPAVGADAPLVVAALDGRRPDRLGDTVDPDGVLPAIVEPGDEVEADRRAVVGPAAVDGPPPGRLPRQQAVAEIEGADAVELVAPVDGDVPLERDAGLLLGDVDAAVAAGDGTDGRDGLAVGRGRRQPPVERAEPLPARLRDRTADPTHATLSEPEVGVREASGVGAERPAVRLNRPGGCLARVAPGEQMPCGQSSAASRRPT